jgi:hypothetical protein
VQADVASASAANLALQAEVSSVSQELAAVQQALAAAQREIQQQQAVAEERQRRFVVVQVGRRGVGWGGGGAWLKHGMLCR